MREQYVRKLGKIGRSETPSYHITLPRELVRQLGWRKGQNLMVRRKKGQLIIEPDWLDKVHP